MKIYLLNLPFKPNYVRCGRWQGSVARGGTLYYPMWLASATGLLEQEKYNVRLIDAIARKWSINDVLNDVEKFGPDLVILESNFSSLTNDIDLAGRLKQSLGKVTIILGGPPASQYYKSIMNRKEIDIVVRFEYDFIVKDIARTIASGGDLSEIKGISFRKDGQVIHNPERAWTTSADLDSIPFISRIYKKHLNIRDYFLGHTLYPVVQLFTGRGCPNQCTFCSWPETMTGRKYRVRSITNIVDEFEYIKKELPDVKEIFIEDDTFTIDKKRVINFCEELHKRNLKVKWSCNARANLDYGTMKAMHKAGCRLLDVGFESGSDEMLKTMRKGVSTMEMVKFAQDAHRANMMLLGDFVFGLPVETKETAEKTIQFAKELKCNIVQFSIATPIPGTEFYRVVKDNGYLLADNLNESIDVNGFQRCLISYPNFTDKDIKNYVNKALRQYYLSPFYVPIALNNIFRKNGWNELIEMVKSAKVFLKYMSHKDNEQRI